MSVFVESRKKNQIRQLIMCGELPNATLQLNIAKNSNTCYFAVERVTCPLSVYNPLISLHECIYSTVKPVLATCIQRPPPLCDVPKDICVIYSDLYSKTTSL